MSVNEYKKRLEAQVIGLSEKSFKTKVNRLFKELSDIHKKVRREVQNYLISNAGRGKIPKVRTGNLVREIARGYVKGSSPSYKKVGLKLIATFTNYWGVDIDKKGRHTVLSRDSRKAPYAYFLNISPKYNKYNGFFEIVIEQYGDRFTDKLQDEFKKTFKTATFRF